MPINYDQVLRQLNAASREWQRHRHKQQDLQKQLLDSLRRWSQDLEGWRTRLKKHLKEPRQRLRVAFPLEDVALDQALTPAPEAFDPDEQVWLAADGSQILPSRHNAFFYGLINVAVLMMDREQVRVHVHSRLYLEHELPAEAPEAFIQEQRLQAEHRWLALAARRLRGEQDEELGALRSWPAAPEARVLAMADGPLELWGQAGKNYQQLVNRLRPFWKEFKKLGVPLVGYVDRPRANLVTAMLALVEDQPQWAQIPDEELFRSLLPPGSRTPVFLICTPGMKVYPTKLQVSFFYLNVGTDQRPLLTRVELHRWVAQQPSLVEQVHAALWQHVQLLQGLGYPYLLHRAHQEAVVTFRHQQELEALLQRSWLQQGEAPRYPSPKQALKDQDRLGEHRSL